MQSLVEGDLLWSPSPVVIEQANLTHYMAWLSSRRGVRCSNYAELWQWSVTELESFWSSIWDFFGVVASQPPSAILGQRSMPGAQWFEGAELNYAENIFARMTDGRPMLLYKHEGSPLVEISWRDAYAKTAALAQALRDMGVQRGDRVVAYLPNIPEAIFSLLAAASIGAVWSSCAPDFGSRSVLDRFAQIEPKVLIAVNGYDYNGKTHDRRAVVAELQAGLPTLQQTILLPHLAHDTQGLTATVLWDELLAGQSPEAQLTFDQLPFAHPLWVLYSSGTTGLPKPIVQGHGGILLEHCKAIGLHNDIKAGDRFFWFTSTGWMMWNYLVGSLFCGATAILYNGSPGFPSLDALFELAEASGMTYFGASAAFVTACMKAEIHPNQTFDLSRIRAFGSTGSPLSVDGFQWVYANLNRDLALESLSGGTDVCTAVVGGVRIQPVYVGEIQAALLGAKVQALNEAGEVVVDEVGELVISEPMPSMPLYFWADPGMERYLGSYFEHYPGLWRHGDWIKFNRRGGCVIYGRSDSTINRQGVRMGTSEIYRVVESFDEVVDSLIIDLELLGRESFLPLFVVLRQGVELTDELVRRIRQRLRQDVSPRHVPDAVVQIVEVPYTLSGKKMEVPIRKILLGMDVERAANAGAMRNPDSIRFFLEYAERLNVSAAPDRSDK